MMHTGLRLVSREKQPGSCVKFADWYPHVAHLFRGRFWVATAYEGSPFNCWLEHGEEVRDSLVVQTAETSSNVALYCPRAMDDFYRFVLDDWIYLYGMDTAQVEPAVSRWQSDDLLFKFLAQKSEPIFRNVDGSWWEVFSSRNAAVREALATVPDIEMSEVTYLERQSWGDRLLGL